MIRFLLIFFVLFSSQVHARQQVSPKLMNANEGVGYVVSDDPSWGRLGNQLFVVSTVLAYAWDHNFKPIFPCFDQKICHLSYNRDRIFFRLDTRKLPLQIHERYHYPELSFKKIPEYQNTINLSIRGQFVNYKFFHHQREHLLVMFEPSPEILDYLHGKYADLLSNPKTVAVHVRTYSKGNYDEGLPFVGLEYFELAFKKFPPDSTFVVFTDRLNWCKVNFAKSFPDKSFIYIEGNDHVEDLYLMSMMKHQIISNSTYSWWGAYLNKNPKKKVVCPQQLFRNAKIWPIKDTYLPEWKIIKHDFVNLPYPSDMCDYDEKTADDLKVY